MDASDIARGSWDAQLEAVRAKVSSVPELAIARRMSEPAATGPRACMPCARVGIHGGGEAG